MSVGSGIESNIRQRALRGDVIDRSADVPPPADPAQTNPCKCGKKMVGRINKDLQAQGILQWHWVCCGCGSQVFGGQWHPKLEEELIYERWKAAQE